MKLRDRRGLEVGIFVCAYLTYFGVRVLTEGNSATAMSNADAIIGFERRAGIAIEDEIQRAFLPHPTLVDIANSVYIYGHWPLLIGTSILLFHYRPDDYYRFRNVVLLSGIAGLIIFSLFPVAPPRLTDLPLVDTVTQEANGYRHAIPASMLNEFAAMPSFHAGWNALLGIIVFRAATRWWVRGLAITEAVAMMIAVVVTANHFVVDVVAGLAIVLVGLAVLDVLEHNRRRPTLVERDVRGGSSCRQRREPAATR